MACTPFTWKDRSPAAHKKPLALKVQLLLAEFTQEYESYKGDLFGFCRGGWGPREGKADPPLWQVAELLQKVFTQRYMKHVS